MSEERLLAEQAKTEVTSLRKHYSEADVILNDRKQFLSYEREIFLFSRQFIVYKVKIKFYKMKVIFFVKKRDKYIEAIKKKDLFRWI